MIFAGETEVLEENLPSATLSTTNPTWIDPGLSGERPATNRMSHGTALNLHYTTEIKMCIHLLITCSLSITNSNGING
jgi:hypothetical protein